MATSSMIPHPYTGKNLGEGRAVPSDFRLPWNTTRTMADVWAHDPALDERKPPKVRNAPESKESVPARRGRPSTKKFYLHDWHGAFLHESCLGMTADADHAWKGTQAQVAAIRAQLSTANDLIASEVA